MVNVIDVEANGIVLLDEKVLYESLSWTPSVGEERDLMSEFFTTDLGDKVIRDGAIVPLLSIDDGGYEIICRMVDEDCTVSDLIIVRNGCFPLQVRDEAFFYDLENLMHWPPASKGLPSSLDPGSYSVSVNGYRDVKDGRIVRAGYEFVFQPTASLVEPTAQIDAYMRVFF